MVKKHRNSSAHISGDGEANQQQGRAGSQRRARVRGGRGGRGGAAASVSHHDPTQIHRDRPESANINRQRRNRYRAAEESAVDVGVVTDDYVPMAVPPPPPPTAESSPGASLTATGTPRRDQSNPNSPFVSPTRNNRPENPSSFYGDRSPEGIAAALRELSANDGLFQSMEHAARLLAEDVEACGDDEFSDGETIQATNGEVASSPRLDRMRRELDAQRRRVERLRSYKIERDHVMQQLRAARRSSDEASAVAASAPSRAPQGALSPGFTDARHERSEGDTEVSRAPPKSVHSASPAAAAPTESAAVTGEAAEAERAADGEALLQEAREAVAAINALMASMDANMQATESLVSKCEEENDGDETTTEAVSKAAAAESSPCYRQEQQPTPSYNEEYEDDFEEN